MGIQSRSLETTKSSALRTTRSQRLALLALGLVLTAGGTAQAQSPSVDFEKNLGSIAARGAAGTAACTLIPLPTALPAMTRDALAAVAVIGSEHPVQSANLLHAGHSTSAWRSFSPAPPRPPEPTITKAEKLDLSLWTVIDGEPIPPFDHKTKSSEAWGYTHALIIANKTSNQAFAAGMDPLLTYGHIYQEPDKYRGSIVHINGVMKRLRRFDPPQLAVKEGVKDLYEAYIFKPKSYGANPMVLIFTHKPDGLAVGEEISQEVDFDGYFFKKFRYQSTNKSWHDVPLLIGHAPTLPPLPPVEPETGLSNGGLLLALFLAVLSSTLTLAAFLAWWYRRGDNQIRNRVAEVRSIHFVDPSDLPTPPSRTPPRDRGMEQSESTF